MFGIAFHNDVGCYIVFLVVGCANGFSEAKLDFAKFDGSYKSELDF